MEPSLLDDLQNQISNGPTIKTIETIKKLIDDKVILEIKKDTKNSLSSVWGSFNQLAFGAQKKFLGVVKCVHCSAIFKYNSNNGTSTLRRHSSKCKSQPSIDSYCKSEKQISKTDIERILQCQINFTSSTISSFRINDNLALIQLADSLIAIGAKYGNVSSKNALHKKETIRKHTYEQANQFTQDLKERLMKRNIIKDDLFCLTADIWTEQSSNSSYLQTHNLK